MRPHYQDGSVTVHHGDCLEVMRSLPDDSVDAIVTDPPYGLGFMGKAWDQLPPGLEWATECQRVLKPGGHLLAFGGTRTWHRLACAVEDAGFEVRDSIAWLYGSGFPKSLDVSKAIDKRGVAAPATPAAKQWQGWGTALKPAFEPVVVARKPLVGTVAANVLTHGTGALNIDASRIGGTEGRWPANVVLDESQAEALDEQSGYQRDGVAVRRNGSDAKPNPSSWDKPRIPQPDMGYGGSGGASRFFYVAKAPAKERPRAEYGTAHPTVKPLALMRWLVRLVTPPGGTVLEPFAGSGTTVEACLLEGFNCVAIEREADYLPLIEARIARVAPDSNAAHLAQGAFDFGASA